MKKPETKKKARQDLDGDTMRKEYDFSNAVRGATADRYAQGSNVVILDPDVVRLFPNSVAVNEALRALGGIIRQTKRQKPKPLL